MNFEVILSDWINFPLTRKHWSWSHHNSGRLWWIREHCRDVVQVFEPAMTPCFVATVPDSVAISLNRPQQFLRRHPLHSNGSDSMKCCTACADIEVAPLSSSLRWLNKIRTFQFTLKMLSLYKCFHLESQLTHVARHIRTLVQWIANMIWYRRCFHFVIVAHRTW